MYARGVPTRVCIVDQPNMTFHMTPKDKDMPTPYRDHTRGRCRSWELKPTCCQPQFPNRSAENFHCCSTSTERATWATSRMTDNFCRGPTSSQHKYCCQNPLTHVMLSCLVNDAETLPRNIALCQ